MIHTLAVANYRSIRSLVLPMGQLNLVTGANGSGKSSLYRGLRLLCDVANGNAIHALAHAVSDAFPGAEVSVVSTGGRFDLLFHQPGLLRPLTQAELSDGTLRYLLLIAALMTPRPPPLMVLNEPETSLHPDLLPALGRLMRHYAQHNQLWVVSHSPVLQEALQTVQGVNHVLLDKELSETFVHDQDALTEPSWAWPKR